MHDPHASPLQGLVRGLWTSHTLPSATDSSVIPFSHSVFINDSNFFISVLFLHFFPHTRCWQYEEQLYLLETNLLPPRPLDNVNAACQGLWPQEAFTQLAHVIYQSWWRLRAQETRGHFRVGMNVGKQACIPHYIPPIIHHVDRKINALYLLFLLYSPKICLKMHLISSNY